jgi:hypothetical protein
MYIYFFITFPQAYYLQSLIYCFNEKFSVKILFCKHHFSLLITFMRKGKDPDPYLWLADPGGPKPCGSGSSTLVKWCVLQEREALGDAAPPKLVPKTLDSMREYDETTIAGEGDKAPTEEDAEVRYWHLLKRRTFLLLGERTKMFFLPRYMDAWIVSLRYPTGIVLKWCSFLFKSFIMLYIWFAVTVTLHSCTDSWLIKEI